MRFLNSIHLLMENFKQTFKLLLYRLIMTVVFVALCSAFVLPELVEIAQNESAQALLENVKNVFKAFVSPSLEEPSVYMEKIFGEGGSLQQFIDFILSMKFELILACIGCVVVYLLKRFLDTLVYFTFGAVLNDKMTTYTDTPFFTAFVANLGKASAYAAVYVPTVFLFDVCTGVLCFLLLHFLPLFAALFLCVTLIVAVQSFKLTYTGRWMPAMTADGKRLGAAIRKSNHEKRQNAKTLCLYVVTVYTIIILNAIAAVFTFGSALLITIPTSYLLLICENYVNYYTIMGEKYFINYDRIATNPDHGDSEHFFEYIEEIEKKEETVVNGTENE